MAKFIVGLTGSLGSGCTTTARYLESQGYGYISISADILKPLAEEKGHKFNTRKEKQDFGGLVREDATLRKDFTSRIIEKAREFEGDVVIECFRNPIEVNCLRDEFSHFYLLALYAHKPERNRRKVAQGESDEDFDKIDKRDEAEKVGKKENKYGQQVRKCVTKADVVIDNSAGWRHTDDRDSFYGKVDDFIRLLREPYRPPTENELLMHLAYSVSLHSLCIERQVGAVISSENYDVLSTGYNNVPFESEPCFELYSQCYRKIKKKESLQKVCKEITYCPYCGSDLEFREELFSVKPKTIEDGLFRCNSCEENLSNVLSAGKELDYCRSLHAEENAILSNPHLARWREGGRGNMIIFTTTFPCMLCAKKIANAGIKRVVFVEPYPIEESYLIFNENGIEVEIFEGIKSLSFNWIFRDRDKFIKDRAYKRLNELRETTKGG